MRNESLGGRYGPVGTLVGPVVPWALLEGVFEQILVTFDRAETTQVMEQMADENCE